MHQWYDWPAREAATAYAKVSFTRSACEQSVSTPASRSHALHDLALILAMPMTCNDVVQSMVPEGSVRGLHFASHGRGHRFETCHAHQAKCFSWLSVNGGCQKVIACD
jgi:hypothetical protein